MDRPDSSFRERLVAIVARPNQNLPLPLGQRGYLLPDILKYEWFSIGPPHSNNWVVRPPCQPPPDTTSIDGRSYVFSDRAKGNVFITGSECCTTGHTFVDGSDNISIILGAAAGRQPVHVQFKSSGHIFYWGQNATSNSNTFMLAGGPSHIIVGEGCMFAYDIVVRTHDEHGIVDLDSGETLNPSQGVLFEPYVWIGETVKIMKGVTVGYGSIVGAASIVTKNVPRNSLAAGVPARIIRSRVGWTREVNPPEGSALSIESYGHSLGLDAT